MWNDFVPTLSPRDIRDCLETFLVDTTWGENATGI